MATPDAPASAKADQIRAALGDLKIESLSVVVASEVAHPVVILRGVAPSPIERALAGFRAARVVGDVRNGLTLACAVFDPLVCERTLREALALQRQGDRPGALALIDLVVEVAPLAPRPAYLRAKHRRHDGDLAGALADIDAVIAMAFNPQPAHHLERAAVLARLGRRDEAMPIVESLLTIFEHPDALRLRAALHRAAGDADAAKRDLTRAEELAATGPMASMWPPVDPPDPDGE